MKKEIKSKIRRGTVGFIVGGLIALTIPPLLLIVLGSVVDILLGFSSIWDFLFTPSFYTVTRMLVIFGAIVGAISFITIDKNDKKENNIG